MPDFIFETAHTVDFSTFMQKALYHDVHGYYHQPIPRQSPLGDYITAPELGNLFAHSLASNIIPLLLQNPSWSIAEIGPGIGTLCADLLTICAQHNVFPQTYHLVERAANSQTRQQQTITSRCTPALQSRCHWTPALPKSFTGIVIMNEILDALPVHLLQTNMHKQLQLLQVKKQTEQGLSFTHTQPPTALLDAFSTRNIPIFENYRYELSTEIPSFIMQLANNLQSGVCFIFDYGYTRAHYYHPERQQGTLTCFKQHRQSNNILANPGQQDISVHVDFNLVVESAHAAGLKLLGYTNQEQFLLASGLTKILHTQAATISTTAYAKMRKAAHILTSPLEMGEIIKVLLLEKNTNIQFDLPGLYFGCHRL